MTKANKTESVQFMSVFYGLTQAQEEPGLSIQLDLNYFLLDASLGEKGADEFVQWLNENYSQELKSIFYKIFLEYGARTNDYHQAMSEEE